LETCPEKQPIDSAKQSIEILQQNQLPKEWRIPKDLSVDNIVRIYGLKREGGELFKRDFHKL